MGSVQGIKSFVNIGWLVSWGANIWRGPQGPLTGPRTYQMLLIVYALGYNIRHMLKLKIVENDKITPYILKGFRES